MTTGWQLIDRDSGAVVVDDLEVADGFWSRFRGLQFRAPLPAGSGLLLVPCPSLHTCFMHFAIDVVMLDRAGRVVGLRQGVRPWRVVLGCRNTYAMLETMVGSALVAVGMQMRLRPRAGQDVACPASLRFFCADGG
jgi:uncharacterized membrane protein (UPF0127 family)